MHVTLRNPNCQKTVLDNGATLLPFFLLSFLFPPKTACLRLNYDDLCYEGWNREKKKTLHIQQSLENDSTFSCHFLSDLQEFFNIVMCPQIILRSFQ